VPKTEWSPADAERTVKLAMAGVRRVKCELYNSRNFGGSGHGDTSVTVRHDAVVLKLRLGTPGFCVLVSFDSTVGRASAVSPAAPSRSQSSSLQTSWRSGSAKRDRMRERLPALTVVEAALPARRCPSGRNKLDNGMTFTRERRGTS
jgi:hypothetical protein